MLTAAFRYILLPVVLSWTPALTGSGAPLSFLISPRNRTLASGVFLFLLRDGWRGTGIASASLSRGRSIRGHRTYTSSVCPVCRLYLLSHSTVWPAFKPGRRRWTTDRLRDHYFRVALTDHEPKAADRGGDWQHPRYHRSVSFRARHRQQHACEPYPKFSSDHGHAD